MLGWADGCSICAAMQKTLRPISSAASRGASDDVELCDSPLSSANMILNVKFNRSLSDSGEHAAYGRPSVPAQHAQGDGSSPVASEHEHQHQHPGVFFSPVKAEAGGFHVDHDKGPA